MIESNKKKNEGKSQAQELLTLEELESSVIRSRTSDENSEDEEPKLQEKGRKKAKFEEKNIPQTPPKLSKKDKKEKFNDKVKDKKLEKSLKIKNREKTPRKSKAKVQNDDPQDRDISQEDEEDSSSSMYQKSPSHEGSYIKKSSPTRSFSFQGSPNKEQEPTQSPTKQSPLKSPARSPMKGSGSKHAKSEQVTSQEDSSVVNNIFLSNLSPPSPRNGHAVSVLSGKKAPKKYSPQKYREEIKQQTDQNEPSLSPKGNRKSDSPIKKQKSNSKTDKEEMLLEVVNKKGSNRANNGDHSPIKEASFNSPSKKKLQFNDPIELEMLGDLMSEEYQSPSKKSKQNGHSPNKSPKKGSNEKQKRSPKRGSQSSKDHMNEEDIEETGQEEEGIDLLELINISINQKNATLTALGDEDELTPEELLGGFEMMDIGDYPAYMLFQDEEDRKNYFEELNNRYFEDIDEGQSTPKKKGVEYKNVVFGKRNKIKSSFPVKKNSIRKTELIPS